jgi:hypothetical protein
MFDRERVAPLGLVHRDTSNSFRNFKEDVLIGSSLAVVHAASPFSNIHIAFATP